MTRRLNAIQWVPTSRVNNNRVCVIVCDSAIDSDWVIPCEGTDGNGSPVQANYVILDNLINQNSATIKYGPQQYLVAPYTRRTFALPAETVQVEILIGSGVVTTTLCEANMLIPDEINQLLTSGGASGVGHYNPFFEVMGTSPVADEPLFTHNFAVACQFQNNWNGGVGGFANPGGIVPLADCDCVIYRNGVHVGDLVYHPGGTVTPTTVGGISVTYAVGDNMTILAPHVPDGNIANFNFTFAGTPA